jgi:sterol desaturase/sphingolipid hydroxylase (fatty acid hydroxylase superfamily)
MVVAMAARVPALIGFSVLLGVFSVAEKRWSLHPQRVFRTGWATDVTHFFVNYLFIAVGTVVVFAPLVIAARLGVVPGLEALRELAASQPAAVRFSMAIAVVAITRYWSHRWTHTVGWLWKFHAVHHSSEQLDWLASARLHPVDAVFAAACTGAPLFLLGFDRSTFGAWALFFAVGPFLDHSNVRLRLPGLRWVIPNPEWHHWHHALSSRDVEGAHVEVPMDRNFSPFPVVDVLFGTAYLPSNRWPTAYGVDDPVPDAGYLSQLAYPFTR